MGSCFIDGFVLVSGVTTFPERLRRRGGRTGRVGALLLSDYVPTFLRSLCVGRVLWRHLHGVCRRPQRCATLVSRRGSSLEKRDHKTPRAEAARRRRAAA